VSCFHPMLAVSTGLNSNGKRDIKFVAGPTEWETYPPNDRLKIPCGRCVGCRLEKSRQWANRCMLELQYHESSFFVTLTYDDDHVPVTYYSENDDGEARSALTLRFRDLQLFLKRLRKEHYYERLRFFACGEYGSTTYRPHYHAIIFGLTLDDLRPYKRSPQGYDYFISASRYGSDMSYKQLNDFGRGETSSMIGMIANRLPGILDAAGKRTGFFGTKKFGKDKNRVGGFK
jgi:hypothetical protein